MKNILMDDHFRSVSGVDLCPAHRLDAITSGVLLFAKSKDSARELQELFSQDGCVHKYYIALSNRKPRKKMGTISGTMVKARRGSYKLTRDLGHNPSVTRFISKKITVCGELGKHPLYMFLLKPITGKTHQIRVAMKSLGSPVLGDERYGMKADASCEERAYLHCAAIRCVVQGERIEIISDPFEDGGYFQSDEFTHVFADEWFSPANTQNRWFPELSLLSSSLEDMR